MDRCLRHVRAERRAVHATCDHDAPGAGRAPSGNAALAWLMVYHALPAGPATAPEDSAGYILPLRTLAVTLSLDADDWTNGLSAADRP